MTVSFITIEIDTSSKWRVAVGTFPEKEGTTTRHRVHRALTNRSFNSELDAEATARKIAKLQGFPYVPSDASFMTIAQVYGGYLPVQLKGCGLVSGFGSFSEDELSASKEGKMLATEKKISFIPYQK